MLISVSKIERISPGKYDLYLYLKRDATQRLEHKWHKISRLRHSVDGIDHWEWSGLKELPANASQINSIMVIIEKLMEIEE